MTHTTSCLEETAKHEARLAAWLTQWPNHCRTCQGAGGHTQYQSVPYGSTSADFPVYEPCKNCTLTGLCARCGQPGLSSEERGNPDTKAGPCKFCGWDYNDSVPEIPECWCWEEETQGKQMIYP